MCLGDTVTYIGMFLLFPNIVSGLILIVAIVALVKQAKVEDDYLAEKFLEDFELWKGKTKLIFPYLY